MMWKHVLGCSVIVGSIIAPPALVVQAQSVPSIDELFEEGNAAQAAGKYAEAEAIWRRVLGRDPENASAYTNLGNALGNQGRYEEAEAAHREAIALDPNLAGAYTNLGVALGNQGRYEEAEAAYREAIALDPNYAIAYTNLGVALLRQGRYEEAEAAYREAIALDPNDADAYYNLGIALNEQERYEEAEAAYRESIALDPNHADIYTVLGNTLRDQKRYEEAEAAHREAIALDPNYAIAYNNLGYVFQVQERYEEAIELYQQAIALEPDYQLPQNNLQEAQRLLALRDNSQPQVFDDSDWLPQNEPLLPVFRSVVRIIAETPTGASIGTGWVVKREGNQLWVVTKRHVLTGDQSTRLSDAVEVEFFSEPPPNQFRLRRPAEILHSTAPTQDEDLALLLVDGAPDDIQSLIMASTAPGRDSDIRIIGHHNPDLPWGLERGFVSNRDSQEFQVSQATVGKGSSGSPVLNEQNEVVGILVEILTPSPLTGRVITAGFSYAQPIDDLLVILNRWGI